MSPLGADGMRVVRAFLPFVFFAVLAVLVRRFVRRPWLRVVIVGVPFAAFLAYALLPAFVDETVTETVVAGSTSERSGALTGIDHRAAGTAAIHRLPEAGQREPDGGVNLGRLKGNKGDQQYELPAGTDPDDYGGVFVWCRQFATAFAAAPLNPRR